MNATKRQPRNQKKRDPLAGTIVVANQPRPKRRRRQPKGRQNPNQNRSFVGPVPPANRILPCTLDFLEAAADPFGYANTGRTVCYPDDQIRPSFKFSSKVVGTLTIGTGGFGCILLSPACITNDGILGQVTTKDYVPTTIPAVGAANTNYIYNVDYPFPTAPAIRPTRIVAFGVRVKYIGKLVDRAGLVCPYSYNQYGQGAFPGKTFDSVASLPNAKEYLVADGWYGTTWMATDATDYRFTQTDSQLSTAQGVMGVFISGATSQTAFRYEIVAYYEVQPTPGISAPGATKSESDLPGLSKVRDFFGTVSSSEVGRSLFQRGLRFVGNLIAPRLTQTATMLLGYH